MKNKKLLLGGVAVVVIVVIILVLTVFHKSPAAQSAYKMDTVQKGDIEALVVASGTLNPVYSIDVGTQVSGRILKIYVDFNSPVKTGQILAELDKAPYVLRLQQDQANFKTAVAAQERAKVTEENAQRKYDRAMALFAKNLISYDDKDAAETDYLNAKADVNSAVAKVDQAKSQVDASKVNLDYCTIYAPIDGVVISREISVGQTVAASFTAPVLFKVANDLTKMQVETSIDEADIGKIKEGQPVRFSVDAFSNETFSGEVKQVRYSPTVTSNVVTYTAIVTVGNPELKLRPGMTATASIVTGQAKDALKVSNAALRFTPDLTADQLSAIMKSAFEEMRAKMGGPQGAPGSGSRSGSGSPASGTTAGAVTPAGANGGPSAARPTSGSGFGSGSGQRQGSRSRQMAHVWTLDANGKLKPIFLRLGVTDNSFTQVIWGDLKEGEQIITGANGATGQFGPPSPIRMLTGR
jgi:HlyD family secretion protein